MYYPQELFLCHYSKQTGSRRLHETFLKRVCPLRRLERVRLLKNASRAAVLSGVRSALRHVSSVCVGSLGGAFPALLWQTGPRAWLPSRQSTQGGPSSPGRERRSPDGRCGQNAWLAFSAGGKRDRRGHQCTSVCVLYGASIPRFQTPLTARWRRHSSPPSVASTSSVPLATLLSPRCLPAEPAASHFPLRSSL